MEDIPQLICDVLPGEGYRRYHIDMEALWREIDRLEVPVRSAWDWPAIMHRRYNLDGSLRTTYAAIATDHHVTRKRAEQVVKQICRELRHPRILKRWTLYQ